VISVDTNVLLRRILNDDVEQAAKAHLLFEGRQPVLITDIVLAETVWTLTGKRYSATRDDIQALVLGLLEETNIMFENHQAVWSALNDFMTAPSVKTANGVRSADLTDALIVNKAKVVARAQQHSFGGTYTFDLAAQRLDGTRIP
jgi:predicted nucleic-acid-binding protein